jgi:hypothetical protein
LNWQSCERIKSVPIVKTLFADFQSERKGIQMKWRSLKNPPPVEKEHVLVSIQEHLEYGTSVEAKVMEAFCRYEENPMKVIWFKQDGSGLDFCNNVTHWQPLPKAFK